MITSSPCDQMSHQHKHTHEQTNRQTDIDYATMDRLGNHPLTDKQTNRQTDTQPYMLDEVLSHLQVVVESSKMECGEAIILGFID